MRRARADSLRLHWLPDVVALVTVLVLTGPMWWRGGHALARDMVFTPRYPWNDDAIGMGTSLPRAVPLDAVLATLTSVLDGALVFRLAVGGVLLLAACGAHRAVAGLPLAAQVLVAVAALWNPYVVERLALGQWALLAAYAALWWLLPALRAALDGDPGALPRVLVWSWLGSLTPTGGVLVLLVVVCTCLARPAAGRRAVQPIAVAVLGQLPWLLPSLLAGSGAVSDPDGVAAFASRAERAGGAVMTLVGTGGVWSPFVAPASLGSAFGHVLTGVVVIVLVVGLRGVWRRAPGLVVAAAVGFVLAALAHLPGGAETVRWAVDHVPGAGIVRDGQKWLMPYVVVVVLAAADALTAARERLRRRDVELAGLVAGALALVPVVLMPDAGARTWEAVRPVHLPDDLSRAVDALDAADPDTGAAVTLPWTSYRQFSWGNPLSAADPLPRWTHHDVVVSDELRTKNGTVSGEDRRARELADVLRRGAGEGIGPRLGALGVGWVLVYRDQPDAPELDLSGLDRVESGRAVALYRVPGPVATVDPSHSAAAVASVGAVDVAWGLVGLVALLWLGRVRIARRRFGGVSGARDC